MKFSENLIRKYFKSNLNIKNIIKLLNEKGFEINDKKNLNILKKNKKYIIKKIIFLKKTFKNIFYINLKNIKKKIYIKNIKENIINKYILIYYKEINKKCIFKIKKKQINSIYIYILYNKKYNKYLNKKINFIKKNNFLEINIPYDRIDCNNVYGLCKEIYLIIKKNNINLKLNKYKKNKNYINIKFKNNIINYKYLIINNIKKIYKKINIKIQKYLKILNINIYNNIKDIFNYYLIKFGQKIIYFDFDLFKKKSIIKKYNISISKKKLYKNINNININKKTKNLLIIAPLYKKEQILKKKNKKNKINKYISNLDKKIQNISLQKISEKIKKIYKCKITNIKIKKINKIKRKKIILSYNYIYKKIGFILSKKKINKIIKQIKCKIIKIKNNNIHIYNPIYRKDLNIKEDIIEEIIKIYGYNKIPINFFNTKLIIKKKNKYQEKIYNIKNILSNIGYKEIINFHFNNIKKEKIFFKKKKFIKIKNPISNNLSILRTSLIPNLLDTLNYNIKRQEENIKIFEIGTCYKKKNKQYKKIASIIYGYENLENWYIKKNNLFNFYNIKGDLEYLFEKQKKKKYITFEKSKNKILDKFQNLNILYKKKNIGYIGMLNNKIKKILKIKNPIYLFEIKLKYILNKKKIKINKISKYPINKRDITLIINKNILIEKIIKKCLLVDEKKIKKINIIKIYLNKKLKKKNKKNITIRLYIQDNYKNLSEKNINILINKCKNILKKKFNALVN